MMSTQRSGADEPEATDNIAGREILAGWLATQPDNLFVTDRNFQRTLELYWGEERYRDHIGRLYQFGKLSATVVD